MLDTRLSLALDGGGLVLPATGIIALLQPGSSNTAGMLPRDRCLVVQDFKPEHDIWAARGFDVSHATDQHAEMSVVCLPRSKVQARAMIAAACATTDGPVVIDGQKTDGVDGVLREIKKRAPVQGPISKSHGKLFWIGPGLAEVFADWHAGPALTAGGFWTAPGVFSAGAVDPASALLVAALPDTLSGHVADLGAGWGYLAAHVLARDSVASVHLVEAGHMALECARHNITDPRVQFHWADATDWAPPQRMDAVVMNPPFHASRKADPAIGQAFVASAARLLSPQGTLWMVANRHLPYEAELKNRFATVEEIDGDARFKLFCARRPLRRTR